jgi:hypothetical protein
MWVAAGKGPPEEGQLYLAVTNTVNTVEFGGRSFDFSTSRNDLLGIRKVRLKKLLIPATVTLQ